MRGLCIALLTLCSATASAQYAPNATGIGVLTVAGNDTLRLDPQVGIGLTGTRQIGVGVELDLPGDHRRDDGD